MARAELFALAGIVQRRFVCPFRHSQRQSCDRNPAAIEHAHGVDKSLAFGPEQIFRRQNAVFENQFRGVAGAQPELVFFFPRTKTRRSFFDDKCGKAVRVRGAIGHRDDDQHVGIVAVGAESFGAIQHPVVSFAHRGHARAAGV